MADARRFSPSCAGFLSVSGLPAGQYLSNRVRGMRARRRKNLDEGAGGAWFTTCADMSKL